MYGEIDTNELEIDLEFTDEDSEGYSTTCNACFGTGLDRELDADCLVCWGDGFVYGF
jgi:hypothetical protein